MEKVVGQRRLDRHDAAALQRALAAVPRTGAWVPRGVYRFTSFEEADAWMTRIMARTFDTVTIRVASPQTLVRTKNTVRPSQTRPIGSSCRC